jgi:hypothetical protein
MGHGIGSGSGNTPVSSIEEDFGIGNGSSRAATAPKKVVTRESLIAQVKRLKARVARLTKERDELLAKTRERVDPDGALIEAEIAHEKKYGRSWGR